MTQIMYVCDWCAEHDPECCGHYDRSELRVLPDGTTVCKDCFDGDPDCESPNWPGWDELEIPPEFSASPQRTNGQSE